MAQFAQRLGFDLPDALAGDVVHLAYFFERAVVTINQAKTHFEDVPFA